MLENINITYKLKVDEIVSCGFMISWIRLKPPISAGIVYNGEFFVKQDFDILREHAVNFW